MMLRALLFLSLVLASSFPAAAQNRGERRGATPGDFDFYVLALSWSPGFCALRETGDRAKTQCAPSARNGFVVHGLWPQFEQGYPTQCGITTRGPGRAAMEIAAGLYPEEELMLHQWRRHGSCSGLAPTDYFTTVRAARDRVVIPEAFRPDTAGFEISPRDLERRFIEANPGLRLESLAVSCRRDVLQEVRICLTKDLRDYRACDEVDRRGCRAPRIKVLAPGASLPD